MAGGRSWAQPSRTRAHEPRLWSRAVPRRHSGGNVNRLREYSDRLLEFLLRARKPEMCRPGPSGGCARSSTTTSTTTDRAPVPLAGRSARGGAGRRGGRARRRGRAARRHALARARARRRLAQRPRIHVPVDVRARISAALTRHIAVAVRGRAGLPAPDLQAGARRAADGRCPPGATGCPSSGRGRKPLRADGRAPAVRHRSVVLAPRRGFNAAQVASSSGARHRAAARRPCESFVNLPGFRGRLPVGGYPVHRDRSRSPAFFDLRHRPTFRRP